MYIRTFFKLWNNEWVYSIKFSMGLKSYVNILTKKKVLKETEGYVKIQQLWDTWPMLPNRTGTQENTNIIIINLLIKYVTTDIFRAIFCVFYLLRNWTIQI